MTDMSVGRTGTSLLVFGIAILVSLFCGASMASSFPFRAIAPGDALPELSFKNVTDGTAVTASSFKGSPVALVFWGADMDTKKDRSLKTLAAVEESLPFLEQRQVKLSRYTKKKQKNTLFF